MSIGSARAVAMAVSYFLCQPLVAATLGAATSSTSTNLSSTQSYWPQNSLCARALKKPQPTSSTRERDGAAGGGGAAAGSIRTRKGSVVEESGPDYQSRSGSKGGRGGGVQVSKRKGEPAPTTMELEFSDNDMAAVPFPKPPAGFILDVEGEVVLVAPAANRVVTIVDTSSQRPLECMIRRAFQSSDGRDCLLLLPLDMPLQILKIDEEREGLTELSDEELQTILPSAIYALAKRRLHLIVSGFCLTARGGFCYTEEHVLDFKAEYGEGLGGSLTEGVEIANFQVGNSEYIIYTPFDPIMFVVHRDDATGQLKIADDELLDDEVVLDAIEEENEFQALVDEEDAIHETLREAK